VFRIDIETCERCGGRVHIIASIGDPAVIGPILVHLAQPQSASPAAALPRQARAPSAQAVLDLE
jgi:hypothetical protein